MKMKIKIISILILLLITSALNALNLSDNDFVVSDKIVVSTTLNKYTYSSNQIVVDTEDFIGYRNGISDIKTGLRGSYFKIELIYKYKGNEDKNNNINDIKVFKNVNINSIINSSGEKDLNNKLNVNFSYDTSGTGQTIGGVSNAQGRGEIMSIYTTEDTKEKTITLTGTRFHGMAFYGEKIINACKEGKPVPRYILFDTFSFKNYLFSMMDSNGGFNNTPISNKSDYEFVGLGVNLKEKGISSDTCTNILSNHSLVFSAIKDTKLFNNDGSINADNKNLYINKQRTARMMADVMYDTNTDEAFLKYDDKWDTQSGTYCTKKIRFIGCIKHKMWEAFSLSNNIDQILSKRYAGDKTIFNSDPNKQTQLTSIGGMFQQRAYQVKNQLFANGNSFNHLIVNKNSNQTGVEPLRTFTTPNEKRGGSYDLVESYEKGLSIWKIILLVIVIIIAIIIIVFTWGAGAGIAAALVGLILISLINVKADTNTITANYVNNSNLVTNPSDVQKILDNATREQTNKMLNFLQTNNLRNKLLNDNPSYTPGNEYLSNISKNYIPESKYEIFNELFMKEYSNSSLDITKNSDAHGTSVLGTDYFSKSGGFIPSNQSILQPYIMYNKTQFSQSDVTTMYSLGNSLRYGVAAVSAGSRGTILFNMTDDFNYLINLEYQNITRNFFTNGTLNN